MSIIGYRVRNFQLPGYPNPNRVCHIFVFLFSLTRDACFCVTFDGFDFGAGLARADLVFFSFSFTNFGLHVRLAKISDGDAPTIVGWMFWVLLGLFIFGGVLVLASV
jgi:hypothetical protein